MLPYNIISPQGYRVSEKHSSPDRLYNLSGALVDMKKIIDILEKVKKDNRDALLEHEVYFIFKELGIKTAKFEFFSNNEADIKPLEGATEVVVKVVSPQILHKTELGGVIFCSNEKSEILKAIEDIKKRTASYDLRGFLVVEKVQYKSSFGRELICSVRNSKDFGTILGFGIGGVDTEFFGKRMDNSFTVISGDHKDIPMDLLTKSSAYYKVGGLDRENKRLLSDDKITTLLSGLRKLGEYFSYENKDNSSGILISECEINPAVVSLEGDLIAIDGLMKIDIVCKDQPQRPNDKLDKLFHPKSIAVAGVSEKTMNMGRIILNNIIKNGFDPKKVYVVKPDSEQIDGASCYESVSKLPEKVDLLVLAVSANVAGAVIKETLETNKADSLIVIPGGFAETKDGKELEQKIVEMVADSRKTKDKGPVIVGGNCLGVISLPGKYDTFFIPKSKMDYGTVYPYAFISQSGAFVISKISKTLLAPQYAASIGNQMDLTFSDYLGYFVNKSDIKTVAVYVEGFKHLDGIRTARAVRELIKKGKKVIIYKGGRSAEGKSAASGHTASIAGDYPVYKAIMEDAGAFVADSFAEFEDMLKLMVMLDRFKIKGTNLAVISNAGFEAVGMADNLSSLKIAKLSDTTKVRIQKTLTEFKLDKIVTVNNPMDVTPSANDTVYMDCFRAMMEDDSVGFGVFACIPMTPALKSIEQELGPDSIFNKIEEYAKTSSKPFVVVVDSGELYDPACRLIKTVPVFREADRAIKVLKSCKR